MIPSFPEVGGCVVSVIVTPLVVSLMDLPVLMTRSGNACKSSFYTNCEGVGVSLLSIRCSKSRLVTVIFL